MPKLTGDRIPLSLPRVWIGDLLAISSGIPLIPTERVWNLATLAEARRDHPDGPGWAALVVKAFARTAMRIPELRRSYQRFPLPHLWQADHTIASVTVSREYLGEPAVFFFRLRAAEEMSLTRIQSEMTNAKTLPIESIKSYRRLIGYTRWPKPIRRLIWWYGYHCGGRTRAKNYGTMGLSTTAGAGARLTQLISPLTATLSYGPIGDDGTMTATLVFDHRVMDGVTAARALVEIEHVLNTEIADELTSSGRIPEPASSAFPAAHPTR